MATSFIPGAEIVVGNGEDVEVNGCIALDLT
jgi:hypothetical protein